MSGTRRTKSQPGVTPVTGSIAPKVGLNALLTPEESVLILIDHQPFQFANLHSHEPDDDREQRRRARQGGQDF
jgi:hypothetical protein